MASAKTFAQRALRTALWWLFAVALANDVAAMRRDYYFQSISSAQGLAQNTVHAMVQDPRGFVWIATEGGLHRFDGYGFVQFQHVPNDPASLPESFVTALALESGKRLWIGTNSNYLAALDLSNGRITRHRADLGRGGDPRRDNVRALRAGADGVLIVGTAAGVERFDPRDGTRRQILELGRAARIGGRGIRRSIELEIDADGQLWAATDRGLFRINSSGSVAKRMGADEPVFAVHRDARGELWLGGLDGLSRLHPDGRRELVKTKTGVDRAAPVWRIASDRRGRLWIALLGSALLRFDPVDHSFQRLQPQPEIRAGVPDGSILSMMIDRSGLLWVGGEANGFATTATEGVDFPLLFDLERRLDRPASNNVRALFEDESGALWVGTESDGLKRVDPQSGTFENFIDVIAAAAGIPNDAPGIRVLGICGGVNGHLWISTDQGLFDFDPGARTAESVSEELRANGQLSDNHLRAVIRARDGSLWMGSYSAGLAHFQPPTQTWKFWRPDPADDSSIAHALVNHVFEDSRGRIWAATMAGLNVLDPQSGRLRRFEHDPNDLESLSGNLVRGVLEASDGRFWIATHAGLNLLTYADDLERPRFRRFGVSDGLPSNTIYGVMEDATGQIWTSSNLGLARLDPKTGSVRKFGLSDGLQDLEFNGGAQLRLRDGRLLFGGIGGFNLFDPRVIRESEFEAQVVLTSLRVGNDTRNRAKLAPVDRITIEQSDRVLRLRVAALDYSSPQSNLFRYRLEGFDTAWIDAGNRPDITYTNLDAGGYTLRVRGSNHDGRFSRHELDLPLTVHPLWWNSNAARWLFAAVLLGSIAWLWSAQASRRATERRLLREIVEREERLKLALWGSGDAFWDWDIPGNTIHRIGADHLLGETKEQSLNSDEWRSRSVHADDLPRVQRALQAHITGQTTEYESEHRLRSAGGDWIWVRSRGKVVARDAAGNALRMAGTAHDITASLRDERERRIASEVLRSMTEAVSVVDLDFVFVSVNPGFSRITGFSESEVIGELSSMLDSAQQTPDFYRRLRESVDRVGHWKGEIWQRRKQGEEFLGWLEISEVRDKDGVRTHFVCVVSDITDKKRAEQELRYLANYDTLTGLPNRTLLGERLARAVVRARRQETRVAVLFLDLDRFKDINDSMGHAAGDRILKAAAARLLATVRETDTVARLGGDEFTVVLEDLADVKAAEEMAQRIVDAFADPLDLDGRSEVAVSPSIGIALFPDHALVPTDLLKFADTAMYQAKARGRNTWQIYTEAMDAETRRRASILAALRKALDRGELRLLYQPRLSLKKGRISGVEALLRWNSAELGEVSPATFIPLAEETGLILPIGDWVLREAAMTLARWRHQGLDGLEMAVNVSMLQFLRGRLHDHVVAVVEETGVPTNRLEIEVTESMVMANAEQAIQVLNGLKQLGLSIAIDDFGTGYSSLVYLKRLPIDTLKIDKAFVGDLTTDPDDKAITNTIINMAHSLDLEVVAEGVETDEQILYLAANGCDEIQGYWLSRPLDSHHCFQLIRDYKFALPKPAD